MVYQTDITAIIETLTLVQSHTIFQKVQQSTFQIQRLGIMDYFVSIIFACNNNYLKTVFITNLGLLLSWPKVTLPMEM